MRKTLTLALVGAMLTATGITAFATDTDIFLTIIGMISIAKPIETAIHYLLLISKVKVLE